MNGSQRLKRDFVARREETHAFERFFPTTSRISAMRSTSAFTSALTPCWNRCSSWMSRTAAYLGWAKRACISEGEMDPAKRADLRNMHNNVIRAVEQLSLWILPAVDLVKRAKSRRLAFGENRLCGPASEAQRHEVEYDDVALGVDVDKGICKAKNQQGRPPLASERSDALIFGHRAFQASISGFQAATNVSLSLSDPRSRRKSLARCIMRVKIELTCTFAA